MADRQTTTPFHLKLFYRQHSFHHLTDFSIPSPPDDGARNSAPIQPALPQHLQIYTWYSCSIRELSQLLTMSLPSLLPDPAVGTRISFRLVYPDTKPNAGPPAGPGGAAGDGRGRYLSKDMGSVVVGVDRKDSATANGEEDNQQQRGMKMQGEDADKTLQDLRFVIGDYVDCAILPPLADGSVAPPISSRAAGGGGGGAAAGGMRAFGNGPYARDGFRGRAGGPGPARHNGPASRPDAPSGGWHRGDRLPDGGRGSNRGMARGRGRPY